ncbi:TPA: tail fiber protein, partial [Salmonella enterica]|nr:tail fiber protein [Salmonella enterica]HCC3865142.1 tail fiber protein [Salmonella enterica]HCC3880072.1 tail fiber protein [Salmonella enterica]HCC3966436.1 tail fiber protein [Salmonella enterica]HCC4015370.1 tail fiber protein [Salmonella enterica]
MKDIIKPVDTDDGLFHDGDPTTETEGTIVYARIMNDIQGATIDLQTEVQNVLADAGIKPDPAKENQLLTAIQKIITDGITTGVKDATTTQKGIVQLSSATDSDSEAMAATPKAVKAAMTTASSANDNANGRVPTARKVNGHALTADVNVTSQDIFLGATAITDAQDLNSYTNPGLYFQPANNQATTGKNYPEAVAGSLEVYKHAGITQIYRTYSNSRHYIRTYYSTTWTAWVKQYDTANPPPVADLSGYYTKAQSDARYVQGIQLGAHTAMNKVDEYGCGPAPAGCMISQVRHDPSTA